MTYHILYAIIAALSFPGDLINTTKRLIVNIHCIKGDCFRNKYTRTCSFFLVK